ANAIRTTWPGSGYLSIDGHEFQEAEGVFHAEEGFFDLFSFPFWKGNPEHALREPNTAIISKKLAQKYFPNENPVGKTLYAKIFGKHSYHIIGVAKSNDRSFLDSYAVLSCSTLDYADTHADAWGASMFQTYVLLNKGITKEAFLDQIEAIEENHLGKRRNYMTFIAQPLAGLYLSDLVSSDDFHGQWRYMYIFGSVAVFILLIVF